MADDLDKSVLDAADAYKQTAPPQQPIMFDNSVSGQAKERLKRTNSTVSQEGAFSRFMHGIGIPTSMSDINALGQHFSPDNIINSWKAGDKLGSIVHGITGPVGTLALDTLRTIGKEGGEQAGKGIDAALQGNPTDVAKHVLGAEFPLIGPPLAEGNYAGAAGRAIPLALMAHSFIKGAPKAPQALPDVWDGPSPSGTMPVYGDPTSAPPSFPARALEYLVREASSKVPIAGTHISDSIKGSIAKPKTNIPQIGTMDLSQPAAFGNAKVAPVRPRTTPEFDPRNPTVFSGSTEDTSLSPPPIDPPATFGNAKNQPFLNPPSAAKKLSSDPVRLNNRFQPSDLSPTTEEAELVKKAGEAQAKAVPRKTSQQKMIDTLRKDVDALLKKNNGKK